MRVQVQKWDIEVSDEILSIDIEKTDFDRKITIWDKVVKYSEQIKAGSDYPPVYLQRINDHVCDYYKVIDGAHRIKAVKRNGGKKVNFKLVEKIY